MAAGVAGLLAIVGSFASDLPMDTLGLMPCSAWNDELAKQNEKLIALSVVWQEGFVTGMRQTIVAQGTDVAEGTEVDLRKSITAFCSQYPDKTILVADAVFVGQLAAKAANEKIAKEKK